MADFEKDLDDAAQKWALVQDPAVEAPISVQMAEAAGKNKDANAAADAAREKYLASLPSADEPTLPHLADIERAAQPALPKPSVADLLAAEDAARAPAPTPAAPAPAQPNPLNAPPLDTSVAVREPPRAGPMPQGVGGSGGTAPEANTAPILQSPRSLDPKDDPAAIAAKQEEASRAANSTEQRVRDLLKQRQEYADRLESANGKSSVARNPFLNMATLGLVRGGGEIAGSIIKGQMDAFDREHPEIARLAGSGITSDRAAEGMRLEQQAKDANDAGSPVTKRAVKLISSASGVDPALLQGMTASQLLPFYQHVITLPATERAHAIQAGVDQLRLQEEQRNHNLEHSDRQAQIAATQQEKRDAQTAAQANKGRMPAELVQQNSGAGAGAQALLSAADNFDKVGGFGLIGSDSAKYKSEAPNQALAAAIGLNPRARESLSSKTDTLADTYLPGAGQTRGVGFSKLGNILLQTARASQERLRALQAAGYDPAPLEAEHQQVVQALNTFTKRYGKELSSRDLKALQAVGGSQASNTIEFNGKLYKRGPNNEILGATQ